MQRSFDDKSWTLLIANPSCNGEPFEESVVLVLEDNEDGSFGVILNKAYNKTLGELSIEFKNTPLDNTEIFNGGPLSNDKLSLAVYSNGYPTGNGAFSFGIPPEKIIEILSKHPESRPFAFLGYSAWAPDQLKQEVDDGTWTPACIDFNVLFAHEPNTLWRKLLLRACPKYRIFESPDTEAPSLFN